MLIELKEGTTLEEEAVLEQRLFHMGFQVEKIGMRRLTIVSGIDATVDIASFLHLPHVHRVEPLRFPYKLAARDAKKENTIIEIKGSRIGGGDLFVIAGPCSIESKEQMMASAKAAKESGALGLRGGAFKPRTSPYEFQGMGEKGLQLLKEAGKEHGLITVSEIMDSSQIPLLEEYVDILQVGARNMQNFTLLRELGKIRRPILLKRGFSATYQDLLMAAEYILSGGNFEVILCERGIRTFETYTRNTLDLNAVPALKELTHLPILVDPSHGTGKRSLIAPMAMASLGAGADGLMIEVHPDPDRAVSDAKQTISLEALKELMGKLQTLHKAYKSC